MPDSLPAQGRKFRSFRADGKAACTAAAPDLSSFRPYAGVFQIKKEQPGNPGTAQTAGGIRFDSTAVLHNSPSVLEAFMFLNSVQFLPAC